MKKRILSIALVVAMVALAAVGSLAYFKDTDSRTNTMTIGDGVEIAIEEKTYDYEENAWVDYSSLTLYPMSNTDGFYALNKSVRTNNTSETEAAYIRTIVLFEKNALISEDFTNSGGCCVPGLHYRYHANNSLLANKVHGVKPEQLSETVEYDGVEYYVVVFTEVEEIPVAASEQVRSISSVWMDENVTEEIAKGWGETVDVIVLSQAIQTESLTHAEAMIALGEVNEANITAWLPTSSAVTE